jgi:hypothetical protein
VFLAAADGGDDDEALILQQRAGELLLRSGHLDEALQVLRRALETLGLSMASTRAGQILRLIFEQSRLRWRGLEYEARAESGIDPRILREIDLAYTLATGFSHTNPFIAVAMVARSVRLALDAGESDRIARGLITQACMMSAVDGGLPDAERCVSAARAAARADDPILQAGVSTAAGVMDFFSCRFANARRALESSLEVHAKFTHRMSWEHAGTRYYYLMCLASLGELAELNRLLPPLFKDAHERGDAYLSTRLASMVTTLHLAAGDVAGAEQVILEAVDRSLEKGLRVELSFAVALSEIELYSGSLGRDSRRARRVCEQELSSFAHRIPIVRTSMLDLAARTALSERRLSDAERSIRKLEREHLPLARAHAAMLRAGLAAMRGEGSTAALFGAAGDAYGALDTALHAAAARRRQGEIMGGEAGAALVAAQDERMKGQGIRDPARYTGVLAPR